MLKFSILSTAVFSTFACAATAAVSLPANNLPADNSSTKNSSATTGHAAIEHISVYANRQARPVSASLTSVTVLDRVDIDRRQVRDLPALLQQVAGVSVARDGGRGQNSSVFIRGGSSGHTLVLLDGVRIGSATLGYQALAMVPLELVEKIEVIRGPKAAWYGSDALGGVIAITTRQGQKVEFNANIGSFGQAEASLSGSTKVQDNLNLFGTVGTSRAEGFSAKLNADPDDDGYQQSYLKAGADYQSAIGLFKWQSQLNDGYYEFDTSFGGDKANTQQDSHQLDWSLQQDVVNHQLKLSHSIDRDTSYGLKSADSLFETKREEASYQATVTLNQQWNLIGGTNWYQELVNKNDPNYSQDKRTNQSVFSGIGFQGEQWLFDATGRNDNVTGYGSKNTYQLSGGYRFTEQLTGRLSQGTAFKVPTFNDLYWPDFGNSLLKPEESTSREVGLAYNGSKLQLDVVLFDRDLTNLIIGGKSASNVLLASVEGGEFTAGFDLLGTSQNFSYGYLNGKDEKTGLKLVKRPAHKVSWNNSKQWQDWTFSSHALYQSRSFSGKTWDGKLQPELGSYLIWNLGLAYQWQPNITVRAKVDNLFDKEYQTNLGYRTAGVEFGLSVQVLAY
jgi:vitamin B12 transporter